jgi:hypothetical protein
LEPFVNQHKAKGIDPLIQTKKQRHESGSGESSRNELFDRPVPRPLTPPPLGILDEKPKQFGKPVVSGWARAEGRVQPATIGVGMYR